MAFGGEVIAGLADGGGCSQGPPWTFVHFVFYKDHPKTQGSHSFPDPGSVLLNILLLE